MRLEEIGFYTLSDKRARGSSVESPLWRCELILTDRCNLKCLYCRGLREGTVPLEDARLVVSLWIGEGLRNVRFSGGEPTLYAGLGELVRRCRDGGVERIAISTNGTRSLEYYRGLVDAGANDFSISLDAGCCSVGDRMAGVAGSWERAVETIRELSSLTYVTVGMVFTEENVDQAADAVLFADSLGVADIRVIPSAQYNRALLMELPDGVLARHPILRYRVENVRRGRHVRGLQKEDSHRCWLGLDDMAVAGRYHYPCIIYLRERGEPVGVVGSWIREEREKWVYSHDTHADPICSRNCLDVCVDYNNRAEMFRAESARAA